MDLNKLSRISDSGENEKPSESIALAVSKKKPRQPCEVQHWR